jgi:hypothetical protein
MSHYLNAQPDRGAEALDPPSQPGDQTAGRGETEVGNSNGRIHWRRLLQRKLLIRVTIPTAIGLVQLVLSIIAIVSGDARPIVLLFMLPSLLVGYLFGKSTKIGWNDERAQVSLIQAQILLAVSYIVVRIGTHYLLELTLSSRINGLGTALLLVSFGLFFGRSVGLAIQIWHALASRNGQGPADCNLALRQIGRPP